MSHPTSHSPQVAAILLAGGSGNRMAGTVEDKILAPLAGKPVVAHSINTFVSTQSIRHLVIVTRDAAQQEAIEVLLPPGENVTFVRGGKQRQDSVWAGLQAVEKDTDIVLIHDCARPCVTAAAIKESIAKASEVGVACLARPVTDTLKSADSYDDAYLPTTVDRAKLWAMETPQSFRYRLIRDAYQAIIGAGTLITDDLSAIEHLDQAVAFIDNGRPNPKLTTPADLPYLQFLLTEFSQQLAPSS